MVPARHLTLASIKHVARLKAKGQQPHLTVSGEAINVLMVLHQSDFRYTELDGFQVL